jgi:hypothetical protein
VYQIEVVWFSTYYVSVWRSTDWLRCVVKVYYKGKHNLMSDIYKCNKRSTNIVRPHPPLLSKRTGWQYKPSYTKFPRYVALHQFTFHTFKSSCDYHYAALYKTRLAKTSACGVLRNPTFGDGPIKRGNNRFTGSYHFCTSVNIFDRIEIKPLEYLWRIVTTAVIRPGWPVWANFVHLANVYLGHFSEND